MRSNLAESSRATLGEDIRFEPPPFRHNAPLHPDNYREGWREILQCPLFEEGTTREMSHSFNSMANPIIPYNQKLRAYAKELRNNPTPQEALLWERLRRKQLNGFEFQRQVPINEFIVDFYCHELQLAIEVDGKIHDYKVLEDAARQAKLESLNVRFLRFTNEEVDNEIERVIEEILALIE